MKHVIAAIILLSLLTFTLYGEESVLWGSYHAPGNVEAGLAGAFERGRQGGTCLGLYPGLELLLWKPSFRGYAPLDFGLAAEGRLGLPLEKGGGLTLGAAGEGSVHVGFRGFNFPGSEYLDRLEVFARFGISFDLIHPRGFQVGTVATSGANYFLDDNLMVGLSYTGWGSGDYGVDGLSLQVRYRMGRKPDVTGMGDTWKSLERSASAVESLGPVTQFYALFGYAVFTGGYYWDGETFEEGSGVVWSYADAGGDAFELERVLLERTDEGEWWSLIYGEDQERVSYEFLIGPEEELVCLYYRDDEGRTGRYDFDDPRDLAWFEDRTVMDYADVKETAQYRETLTLPSGTYENCYVVEREIEDERYIWWFTEQSTVPGRMVQCISNSGADEITGRLERVITGRRGDYRLR